MIKSTGKNCSLNLVEATGSIVLMESIPMRRSSRQTFWFRLPSTTEYNIFTVTTIEPEKSYFATIFVHINSVQSTSELGFRFCLAAQIGLIEGRGADAVARMGEKNIKIRPALATLDELLRRYKLDHLVFMGRQTFLDYLELMMTRTRVLGTVSVIFFADTYGNSWFGFQFGGRVWKVLDCDERAALSTASPSNMEHIPALNRPSLSWKIKMETISHKR